MRVRVAVLLACGILVYWNAMPAPFILDDTTSIVRNATIRQLWPASVPLSPPPDTPVARRPLVNLTFAANYAAGGLDPRGYRAVNLLIHLLAALVLFGIVRRTLRTPAVAAWFAGSSPQEQRGRPDTLAWVAALLWLLHPLNSEVVDYVTERSESLMALAYLLTMYCAVRAFPERERVAADNRARRKGKPMPPASPQSTTRWTAGAIACCAAGMLCKESMVTAPVLVMLYDRVFLFDSWREAARVRARLYAGLGASWVVLALVLLSGRRTTAGFGTGISPVTYLLNQVRLIAHYLFLTVWPRELVVDYGLTRPIAPHDLAIPAIVLAAVLIAAVVLFVRAPRIGFGVAWFFIILAPTSSIVPIATEVGAERRMYLPLAGLLTTLVVGAYLLLRRVPWRVQAALAAAVCLLAGVGAYARNREYLDPLVLARVTVDRWPTGRSRFFYGTELVQAGRNDDAITQFGLSAATYPGGHYALGSELVGAGRVDEGLAHLREFIHLAPNDDAVAPARDLMGRVFITRGQLDAAAEQFNLILAREPHNVRALVFLGDVRLRQARNDEAIAQYERAGATGSDPGDEISVSGRLAAALASAHRLPEAVAAAQDAVARRPDDPEMEKLLGQVLAMSGRVADAVPHFRRAVALAPGDPQARDFLGAAEREAGQSH